MTDQLTITRATARKLIDWIPDSKDRPGTMPDNVAKFFDDLSTAIDEAQAEAGDDQRAVVEIMIQGGSMND